jgi:hypothetical protein
MSNKLLEHRVRHRITLYEFTVWVVLTNDMQRSREGLNRTLGKPPGDCEVSHCVGLTSRGRGRAVAIFLLDSYLGHGLIAHELFHATHSIMEFLESQYIPETHEPYSALCEYLTKLVYADLKRWGARVK